MPDHCAAYSCSNRRTVANRNLGITFHKFPRDKDVRKKWEVALRGKGFTASDSSVLCSHHFKKDDFDRTGQIVRLRDGVIPSVFSVPVHLQRVENAVSNGLTGVPITDEQRRWNSGTQRNITAKPLNDVSFTHHRASDAFQARDVGSHHVPLPPTPLFLNQEALYNGLKHLKLPKTSLLYKCVNAE